MFPVHRSLHGILAAVALVAMTAPVAAAGTVSSVNGVGTGSVASGGALQPIGDGRFRVLGREYQAHLSSDDASTCFRGSLRVSEEAILSVPHYAGSHEGVIDISGDAGTLQLRYRGDVNHYEGKGSWLVVRGTGGCADLSGSGTYTSAFLSSGEPSYRLELHGRVNQGD
jgi:hypothetical protein